MSSTFYELVVVISTMLVLSASILGWSSVKEENGKVRCAFNGYFGRVKMLYLGMSAVFVGGTMLKHLDRLYSLLGSNGGETIALAYALILGTVILTVLILAAILRFSAKWHRLKIIENLYTEQKRHAHKPATVNVKQQQPHKRRRPASLDIRDRRNGERRHPYIFDVEAGTNIYVGGTDPEKFACLNAYQQHVTSAEDMQVSAEAVSALIADAFRQAALKQSTVNILLLAKSQDGTAQSVAELGDPATLPDPDQEYKTSDQEDENPEANNWTYQDCPLHVVSSSN